MSKQRTSINESEVEKFSQHATDWWDKNGPLKTLHDINPIRLSFIEQHISLSAKRVMDLGCGGGILTEALARAGAEMTGVDAAKEGIAVAKAHAKQQALEIDYHAQAVESFDAEPFDAVICMEMLEHVDEPSLVIEHIARLTKPGGLVFLSTINRTPVAYGAAILAAEYLLKLLPRQTHDYSKFIKPHELAAMGRKHGLELVAMSGLRYNPLTSKASLHSSVGINYLMVLQNAR